MSNPTPLRAFSRRQIVLWGAIVAAIVEAVTCVLRFGFDLQSTRDTTAIGSFTGGLRIHHGYIGLLLMALAALIGRLPPAWKNGLMIAGIGLLVSDLVHHFLVLWPITGSPHFDIWYG